jgi:hypothetical protein
MACMARGLTVLQAIDLLRQSVRLVQAARAQFWQEYDGGRKTEDGTEERFPSPVSQKAFSPGGGQRWAIWCGVGRWFRVYGYL